MQVYHIRYPVVNGGGKTFSLFKGGDSCYNGLERLRRGMKETRRIVIMIGGNTMQAMDAAKLLAQAIQESPEYREYIQLKKEIDDDAGIKALIQEYRKLQTGMQMRMLSGQGIDSEETQRFNSLSMLLFADNRTSGFLMAEMKMQRMMAEIFETLTQAAGMEIPVPGM